MYIASLEAKVLASNKEWVYGLIRPNQDVNYIDVPIYCVLLVGVMQSGCVLLSSSILILTKSSLGCLDIIEHSWLCLVIHYNLVKLLYNRIIPNRNMLQSG